VIGNQLEADRAAYEIFMMMGQEKRFFTDQLVALAKDIAKAGEQMPVFYKYAQFRVRIQVRRGNRNQFAIIFSTLLTLCE